MNKQILLIFLLNFTIISTTFCAEIPQLSYWQRFKNWITLKLYDETTLPDEQYVNIYENLSKNDDEWRNKAHLMRDKLTPLNEPKQKIALDSLLFPTKLQQPIDNTYQLWATDFLRSLTKKDIRFLKLASLTVTLYKSLSPEVIHEKITKEIHNLYNNLPELKKLNQIVQQENLSDPEKQKYLAQQFKNLPFLSIIEKLLQKRDFYLSQKEINLIKILAINTIIQTLFFKAFQLHYEKFEKYEE